MPLGPLLVLLAMLIVVGDRRSIPKGATASWRDRAWVAAAVFAVGGASLVGFVLGQSGIRWPDNAFAAAAIATIALIPLAACAIFRLVGKAR